jgi:hypothetical protein
MTTFKYISLLSLSILATYLIAGKTYSVADINMENERGYVIAELFTSQSCSSCPVADAFLEELNKKDNIIALSCNVTYWNHLHWEDTLSKDFCTQKQRGYSNAQNRNGRIFTPELMINGEKSLVGSRQRQVINYLSSPQARSVTPIEIARVGNELIVQPLHQNPHFRAINPSNKVRLITYGKKHTQYVPSGENRGRTIHYTNPVTNLQNIGTNWDGSSPISIPQNSIPAQANNTISGYVVLISEPHIGGKIIAAGKLSL